MTENGDPAVKQFLAGKTATIALAEKAADKANDTLEFSLEVYGEKLHLQLPPTTQKQSLAWLSPIAQWASQQILSLHTRRLKQAEQPLACCSGCTHCCHLLVPLSVSEAMFLTDWLESHTESQVQCLRQRFQEANKVYLSAAEKMQAELQPGRLMSTVKLMRMASREEKAYSPCPLLWDDLCSQYLARPIACREHISRTKPPTCNPADRDIHPPLSILEALIRTSSKLEGNITEIVPLRRIFAWADTHRRRWDKTFSAAELLGSFQSTCEELLAHRQDH